VLRWQKGIFSYAKYAVLNFKWLKHVTAASEERSTAVCPCSVAAKIWLREQRSDEEKAFELTRNLMLDVILMDINMPHSGTQKGV
jgi:hypothetical protein